MFQVVRDLPPPGQPQGLHGRVLHVHVGVHAVVHQLLHDGVVGGAEVVVRPELREGGKIGVKVEGESSDTWEEKIARAVQICKLCGIWSDAALVLPTLIETVTEQKYK